MESPLFPKKFCEVVLLLMLFTNSWAQTDTCQNQLSITLDHLTQGEIRGGGLPKSYDEGNNIVENHTNFIIGRTRLSVDFQRSGLEVRAVAQNEAVWGANNNSTLTLYEAWIRLNSANGLFAQIGRIPLAYDDERIIGPNDWAMAANSHDVLRIGYEGHRQKIHALFAYNQNNENINTGTFYENGAQFYKSMQILWYHYDLPKLPLGVSLLMMNIGMQAGQRDHDPHTEYQQLVGSYLKFHPMHWTLEGAYYRQMGYNEYSGRIKSWMASIKATIQPTNHYDLEVGFDYLSGDDYVAVVRPGAIGLPRHEVYKGFNTLCGSHHKFYGIMDYFYESAHIQGFSPGLQNAYIGAFYRPIAPLTFHTTYHYMAVSTYLENLNMTLGHDIDLEVSYRFSSDISLSAGFSYMTGTETLNQLKQGDDNKNVYWGWLSLSITPNIFKTKW